MDVLRYSVLCLSLVGLTGCRTTGSIATRQEDLGKGIVWGTLGVMDQHGSSVGTATPVITGQVTGLEGAAYVVRQSDGREARIPHDENTRVDRPAHLGDRIEAILDVGGRATRIRNIDGRMP